MDNSYSKRQLLRMERRVLCELDFELSHCPPLHFLLLTASIAHCSDKVRGLALIALLSEQELGLSHSTLTSYISVQVVWMARYLLELSLLENQFVVFQPVQLASAALCLARLVLQEVHSPESETAWCIATSLHICR